MQQLAGQFPVSVSPATLIDTSPTSTVASWTAGRQSIAVATSQPTIVRPWTIYGWSIQGFGYLLPAVAGHPVQGKLGKLMGAIMFGGTFNPVADQPFAQPPQLALPNLATLWDGSQDQPFPFYDTTNQNYPPQSGPFAGSFPLPVPQRLSPADQIAIGLWLTPSEVQNLEIGIMLVNYTVTYDSH